MTQVTFPQNITGRTADTTYSDDNTPGIGMADGGHQELWMPLMQDVVSATQYIAEYALAIDTADENAAAALLSEQHAATSESNAAASATAALGSQNAALLSEQQAAISESNAASSQNAAATSESNAASSQNAAAAAAASAQASAATAISAPGTQATSTSTLTLATGLQNLTVQPGKQLAIGMSVKIADSADGTRWLHGDITAYNSSTGQLSVNVQTVRGTGAGSSWIVSISAPGSQLPFLLAGGTTVTLSLW